MAVLRCAVHAQFSSDLQRATSIDDQIATALASLGVDPVT